jgi:NAD(P)-dependent dehydrogenase (short-subunit alcohol dehydrogenase family)
MTRPLSEQIVVITGASSGIGRATALRFAREGASVVLAGRGSEGLESAAEEVRRVGGRALAVETDVSRWQDVERLGQRAVDEFGRIDTWINNAAVSLYAPIDDTTPEEFERIIDVNLLGQMFGSRVALLQMKRQGSGTILNVASALAQRSVPLQASYCASKHGVKGFTEALRLELRREHSDIQACLVMPSSINTPLFSHARSKLPVKPMPIPPIYEPDIVAESLVRLAVKPQPETVVGGSGKLLTVMERLSPGLVDWYMVQQDRGYKQQLSDKQDDGKDNLFEPFREHGATYGEYGEKAKSTSVYTETIEEHPGRKSLLVGGMFLGFVALTRRLAR